MSLCYQQVQVFLKGVVKKSHENVNWCDRTLRYSAPDQGNYSPVEFKIW